MVGSRGWVYSHSEQGRNCKEIEGRGIKVGRKVGKGQKMELQYEKGRLVVEGEIGRQEFLVEGEGYRMCVYLGGEQEWVELVDWK